MGLDLHDYHCGLFLMPVDHSLAHVYDSGPSSPSKLANPGPLHRRFVLECLRSVHALIDRDYPLRSLLQGPHGPHPFFARRLEDSCMPW